MDVRKVFKYPAVYMENNDRTSKILLPELPLPIIDINPQDVKEAIQSYNWKEGDFLLESYPKTGTHLCWEIMSMLLKGKSELLKESKMSYMVDLFMQEAAHMPFPKVLNTHIRLDMLPREFQNRKTVYVTRNPKDTCLSGHHHFGAMLSKIPNLPNEQFRLEDFAEMFLTDDPETVMYGSYFDYTEFMWNYAKERDNILVVFYEDLILDPLPSVKKINEFMETNRSEEFLREVVERTKFKNMKGVKNEMPPIKPTGMNGMSELRRIPDLFNESESVQFPEQTNEHSAVKNDGKPFTPPMGEGFSIFRKGIVGDWKNSFSAELNEKFDQILAKWKPANEINFTYG